VDHPDDSGPDHPDDQVTAAPLPVDPYISDPVGSFEGPPSGAVSGRVVLLWGWVVDRASANGPGIHSVGVYLDDAFKGTATYGLPRHDVRDIIGSEALRSGWQFALDLKGTTPGPHIVRVSALSAISHQETSFSQSINVAPLSAPPAWRKFVLFISGAPGDTLRYRCDHAAEQVRLMGGTADVAVQGEVDLGAALDRYHVFVLHRVQFREDVGWFLEQARGRQLPVIYDVDDFVFDVQAASNIGALERLIDSHRAQFMNYVAQLRETLVRTDAVLVSTEPLRAHVDGLLGADCARVAPNVVTDEMVRQADAALEGVTRDANTDRFTPVTVAYLSGTPTHDRDFLSVADSLIWALDRFPNTRLLTVGPVAIDQRFQKFGQRVEQRPLYPWQQLPEVYTSIDINIAPLEPDNQFNESKSCIKYLEAALVGIPTVASPRADFRRVITQGVNGFLADTADEWRAALRSLIESSQLRHQVGQRARRDVLRQHTTASAARSFCATLAAHIFQPSLDQRLVINWVVPSATDSHRADPSPEVSHLVRYLCDRGHRVRLCVAHSAPPPADVTVATDWSTAQLVAEHGASPFRAYFVQDDPIVTRERHLRQSHSLPLRYICYGQVVARHLAAVTRRPIEQISGVLDGAQAGAEFERILVDMTYRRGRAEQDEPVAPSVVGERVLASPCRAWYANAGNG
jgi:glycosyltransferase involved in cell wall biosynthesis